jgi:hypothetical protein
MNLDTFRAIADRLRPLGAFMRKTSVVVRTRTWSGDRPGEGVSVDNDLALPGYVNIREISAKEIASSGGRFRVGDLEIGPITPPYSVATGSGGISGAELRPSPAPNAEVFFVLTGELSGEYKLVKAMTTGALSYRVVARRRRTTP